MKSRVNLRLIALLAAALFGAAFSAPSLLNLDKGPKITLGLDLQGGLYMLLGVNTDEAVDAHYKSIASSLNYYCEKNDILIDELTVEEEAVTFQLLDPDERTNLEEYINDTFEGVAVHLDGEHYALALTPEEVQRTRHDAVVQSVDTIRNRLDQFGLAEPNVAKQGDDKILVEIPGIKTPEEEQRARKLIGKAAHLQLMAVDEENQPRVEMLTEDEVADLGDVVLPDVQEHEIRYLLKSIAILDGSMLVDARVGFDENNQPVINFTLNGEGASIFGDFSGKSVGKRMAVVLDGKVYSAPVIRERIGGGSGQISGNFQLQEAHDLAIALRSGSLAASVKLLEKRSVGPSLGADSITASAIALIGGFLLVTVFMVWYYRVSGLVSNVALLANLLIIIAVMALFGATLTLPGMVGIVLTVGMAVDANVIINERIKELLYEGKSLAYAIENGYKNAFSAILDANVTTLIAAVALYAYGTGPIKGFAVTLSIGILASMLTAIVGTHGLYDYLAPNMTRNKNIRYWFGLKGEK